MSKELDLDDVAATSDLATTELMRLRGERDDAQARIRELEAERDKLIQDVADHVTVRAEQYQQIQELQAELATAAVTDDRAIADTVNDLRIVAIKFRAAEQLRARIADVIVPGLKRIQKLEELNDKRLGEIRTTLKLLAEARGERDALREQYRNTVESHEFLYKERDTLRAQVRVLVDLLDAICKSNPRTQLQSELFEQARAALAAAREPVPTNEPAKLYFWGIDEEQSRLCSSLEEAHRMAADYIDDNHIPGSEPEYEVGEACPALEAEDSQTTRQRIAEHIIETLDMWAGENSGAEDATFDLAKEDIDGLGNLVIDYVLSKANHQWFTVKAGTVTKHRHVASSPAGEGGE